MSTGLKRNEPAESPDRLKLEAFADVQTILGAGEPLVRRHGSS